MLHRRDSTGSTGSNGEGISLLRIGSITLPSSMDLRQYLEQMQACLQGFLRMIFCTELTARRTPGASEIHEGAKTRNSK